MFVFEDRSSAGGFGKSMVVVEVGVVEVASSVVPDIGSGVGGEERIVGFVVVVGGLAWFLMVLVLGEGGLMVGSEFGFRSLVLERWINRISRKLWRDCRQR